MSVPHDVSNPAAVNDKAIAAHRPSE